MSLPGDPGTSPEPNVLLTAFHSFCIIDLRTLPYDCENAPPSHPSPKYIPNLLSLVDIPVL